MTVRPGPAFAQARAGHEPTHTARAEPPSAVERRLRTRIGEAVATQAIEDEAGLRMPRTGEGLYHRYNAVLKRVFGNKGRAEMTLPELEAALAWLERNRLSDHLHLLEGDSRYAWTAAKRRRSGWLLSQVQAGGRSTKPSTLLPRSR
jgi:hypothetical protein